MIVAILVSLAILIWISLEGLRSRSQSTTGSPPLQGGPPAPKKAPTTVRMASRQHAHLLPGAVLGVLAVDAATIPLNGNQASLPSGTRVGGFTLDHLLGTGGQGNVYLATAPDGRGRVALKGVEDAADWAVEAHLLRQLRHPGVPAFVGAFQEGVLYWLAMEYIAGNEPARGLPCQAVFGLGARLAGILAYLHGQGIIHRDIKPENTLIATAPGGQVRVVLADFGTAIQPCRGVGVAAPCGTHGYIPPEQYRNQSCPASDIYALGVTLWELLAGKRPDPRICEFPPLPAGCPNALGALLHVMLALRPEERPLAGEVEQQLSHLARRQRRHWIWYGSPVR